jgi:hypothetical protein
MYPKAPPLKGLTAAQRKTLRGDNPYTCERNALIQELYARGAQLPSLTKVTGLSKSTVHRIATQGYIYGRRRGRIAKDPNKKVDFGGVQGAINNLWTEIFKII